LPRGNDDDWPVFLSQKDIRQCMVSAIQITSSVTKETHCDCDIEHFLAERQLYPKKVLRIGFTAVAAEKFVYRQCSRSAG
jgi:hypothetical protein